MPVMPGAEPFSHQGGGTGVLLCHGFTGSPQSLRPWAEYLAAAGLTVSLPRLPGHGTTWQDMARTRWEDWFAEVDRAFDELRGSAGRDLHHGLVNGRLPGPAAGGAARRRGQRAGPGQSLGDGRHPHVRAGAGAQVPRSFTEGHHQRHQEAGRDRGRVRPGSRSRRPPPCRACGGSPSRLWRLVSQPVLVYRSLQDHVVGPASLEALRAALPDGRLEVRELADSYHVATLDNDAEAIFKGSLEFVQAHRAGRD